eukprot:1159388-Pelagomonas_calceolata.AAC.2
MMSKQLMVWLAHMFVPMHKAFTVASHIFTTDTHIHTHTPQGCMKHQPPWPQPAGTRVGLLGWLRQRERDGSVRKAGQGEQAQRRIATGWGQPPSQAATHLCAHTNAHDS